MEQINAPAVNIEDLVQTTGLEAREVIDLLELFCGTTFADLALMREALRSGDLSQVSRCAHSIKGAALGLSLYDLAQAAEDVEDCAREGGVTGHLNLIVELLLGRFDSVRSSLRHP